MKTYLSWSGGKDSTASIILCYEKGIHIDEIVFCEIMFDHKRNISGEDPEHIDWVYNIAIPIIENQFGYKVKVIRPENDYYSLARHVIKRSRNGWNGYVYGFVQGGFCFMNSEAKVDALKKYDKSLTGEYQKIVGIAYDEPKRLERLKGTNKISVLADYMIVENQTYDMCKKYNLLSPIYKNGSRGGCWFCPNKNLKGFAKLKKNYPLLWEELREISKLPNLTTDAFMYKTTFEEVEKQIDLINNQITLFDFIKE